MSNYPRDALRLVKPSEQHEKDVLAYQDEFVRSGDSMDGTAGLGSANSFDEWLQAVRNGEKEETVQEGFVPASEYLAIREADKRLVGMVSIRHRLNDYLLRQGGHIGYSVRESERRKGYATEMLKQSLQLCKELGISKVLVICKKDNIGSARVIQANGGILEDEVISREGELTRRYWITPAQA